MKAVLYARVSKIDADDPKSIPTQRADCRALAEEIGADIVGEFVDIDPAHFREDNVQLKMAHAMVGNQPDAIDRWTVKTFVFLSGKRAQKAWTDFGRLLWERTTIDGPEAETFIQARLEGWIPA